jgi:hypothetical protein
VRDAQEATQVVRDANGAYRDGLRSDERIHAPYLLTLEEHDLSSFFNNVRTT